jgi:DNA-directed RNA polymerase subunit beta
VTIIDLPKMNKNFKLPDFIEIQRASFLTFLEKGIAEEIQYVSPIQSQNGAIQLVFYPDLIQFKKPKPLPQEALRQSKTYSASLYVPAQLFFSHPTKKLQAKSAIETIFLGEIPFMTERGTFIINGSPRVIVNQIVRSPGIYYKMQFDKDNNKTFVGSIISNRGSWLRVETDKKGLVFARMDKIRKIPIFILFFAMGFTEKQVFQSIGYSTFLKRSLDKVLEDNQGKPMDQKRALVKLHFILRPDRPFTANSARELLESRFMDPERYDLGKLGRIRLNKKLKLIGSPKTTILRPEDILASVDYLINLEYGIGNVDDIDDLKNRRVRTAGELVQNQIRIGMGRLDRIVKEKLAKESSKGGWERIQTLSPKAFINPKPIIGSLREFFGSSQLSQYMDQTNPLAEITHKRRISSLGPGGLSKDRAGLAVREIHPSHYGRICPIETPEGGNAGLVSSLTTYARIDYEGFLECPFYKVNDAKVQFNKGPHFLSAEQEERLVVSPGDIRVSNKGKLNFKTVPVRYQKEFTRNSPRFVQYIGISPIQMISVATSLIPFLEHDDANRVLMGSNMQRQAVPLVRPERPIIGTGLEAQVARDSGTVLLAKKSGVVKYVSSEKVLIQSEDSHAISNSVVEYSLQKYQRSNQSTCMTQRPAVSEGEYVQKGDLIADGAATAQGELALGKNILVAYMPWEGYNFEDAVLVSERLVLDDVYTSIHIEKYDVEARETKLGSEEFTKDIPNMNSYLARHLDDRGIVKQGSWVLPGDILVGKVTPKGEADQTPEGRLLRAIFLQKSPDVSDSSLKVPGGVRGRVLAVRVQKNTVRIYLAERRKVQIGDKVAGRHGNKGIISNILPPQDMPFLQDGTPVDMVLNPLGVPSRMNVGQVFECLLGLAGKQLNQTYKVIPFDEMYGKQASRGLVYRKLYEARQKTGKQWLFDPRFAGKSKVFDGRTGIPFDQPILFGYPYVLKLVHQVDDKIHARSTGPYSLVTQQPLGGRAKHGGQRLGEMEVWALEGFGAAYTLQELLTVKSDDMQGRNDVLSAIIKGQPIPKPGVPESFKVLMSELRSLCLDVTITASPNTEMKL